MFFPYDANKARCHPIALSIITPYLEWGQLTIQSNCKVTVKCSRCDNTFHSTIGHLRMQTGQCRNHFKDNCKKNRPHYLGDIPKEISRPIRAGILLCVDREKLIALLCSLDPLVSDEPDVTIRRAKAIQMIDTIRATYDDVTLADNCFWGDNYLIHKNTTACNQSSKTGIPMHSCRQTERKIKIRLVLFGCFVSFYERYMNVWDSLYREHELIRMPHKTIKTKRQYVSSTIPSIPNGTVYSRELLCNLQLKLLQYKTTIPMKPSTLISFTAPNCPSKTTALPATCDAYSKPCGPCTRP